MGPRRADTFGGRFSPEIPMKESQLLRLCLDWLAANQIMAFRQNTGAIKLEKRFFRFGVAGMSDVLAFKNGQVYWLEMKAPAGKQSALQWSFQLQVQNEGHRYHIIRSLEDLEAAFQ